MIWLQNLLVVCVFALIFYLIRRTYRKSAFRDELATGFKRPLARFSVYLLSFYGLVAFLDFLYISSAPGDTLLQSIIAWIPEEDSYSIPWAFYDLQGESLNGWHLLGTNINGKDVLGLVLSGSRPGYYPGIAFRLSGRMGGRSGPVDLYHGRQRTVVSIRNLFHHGIWSRPGLDLYCNWTDGLGGACPLNSCRDHANSQSCLRS